MAATIAGHRIDGYQSHSAEDLRRMFESAICQLHEADFTGGKRLQYRTPIVQRGAILGTSQANREKRALMEAARALAQLWKI